MLEGLNRQILAPAEVVDEVEDFFVAEVTHLIKAKEILDLIYTDFATIVNVKPFKGLLNGEASDAAKSLSILLKVTLAST